MCDGGPCELVGSGGACGAGSTDGESSDCLCNPVLDGKISMLNKYDDDNDVDLKMMVMMMIMMIMMYKSIVHEAKG